MEGTEDTDSERVSNLSKAARLIKKGARIHAQMTRLQNPHSFSLDSFTFAHSIHIRCLTNRRHTV